MVPSAGGDAKWRSVLPYRPFWRLWDHWELGLHLSKTRLFGTWTSIIAERGGCYWSTASVWMGTLSLKSKTKPKTQRPNGSGCPVIALDLGHQNVLWVALRGICIIPILTVSVKMAWGNPSLRLCRCQCQPANMHRACLWGVCYIVPSKGCNTDSGNRQQHVVFDLLHTQPSLELISFQWFLWFYGFLIFLWATLYFSFCLTSFLKTAKDRPCCWVVIVI